jgi:CRP-like cAMP-binding protein
MNKTHNPTPHTSLSHQQGYIGQRPALGLSQESGQLLAHALDEIACGVIIVDGQGHVQHCNLAGQMILQRGQLLSSEQATLQAVEAADAPALAEALAKAMQGKRSMLNLGKLAQSTVAVVPLDRAERWGSAEPAGQSANSGASSNTPSTRIALIFSRTGMCETLMMSFFSRAYQLTRSEEQILSLNCAWAKQPCARTSAASAKKPTATASAKSSNAWLSCPRSWPPSCPARLHKTKQFPSAIPRHNRRMPTPKPTALPESIAKLAEAGVQRSYKKKSIIVSEGDSGDTVFILLEGSVRVFGQDANGREVTYGNIDAPSYFGEMSLDGGPRSASIEATTPCRCAVVTRERVKSELAAHPELALELITKIIARARSATDTVRSMALKDAYGRLREVLEELASEPGEQG